MDTSVIHGAGIGLRTPHAQEILASPDLDIPWLEVLADNWLAPGGLNRGLLLALSERYPMVLHGVGLSLGGLAPLDFDYLARIKLLKQDISAHWYSEHASFSQVGEHCFPDLLPLPYTEEAARHLSERILQVQDFLGEPLLLENISAYVEAPDAEMTEAEFIRTVAELADCKLLLDINNVFVSSFNFGRDPQQFLQQIPLERVQQIHLAGFEDKGDFYLDAHNNPIASDVWKLFKEVIDKRGAIPSMVEWDNDVPPLQRLLQEQQQAAAILQPHLETGHTSINHSAIDQRAPNPRGLDPRGPNQSAINQRSITQAPTKPAQGAGHAA